MSSKAQQLLTLLSVVIALSCLIVVFQLSNEMCAVEAEQNILSTPNVVSSDPDERFARIEEQIADVSESVARLEDGLAGFNARMEPDAEPSSMDYALLSVDDDPKTHMARSIQIVEELSTRYDGEVDDGSGDAIQQAIVSSFETLATDLVRVHEMACKQTLCRLTYENYEILKPGQESMFDLELTAELSSRLDGAPVSAKYDMTKKGITSIYFDIP